MLRFERKYITARTIRDYLRERLDLHRGFLEVASDEQMCNTVMDLTTHVDMLERELGVAEAKLRRCGDSVNAGLVADVTLGLPTNGIPLYLQNLVEDILKWNELLLTGNPGDMVDPTPVTKEAILEWVWKQYQEAV